MPREKWMPVVGWETRYEISDLGRVKNSKTGRLLKPVTMNIGYMQVTLQGPRANRYVHRLVLETFVGAAEGRCALHWDDDKSNNELVNLRWGSRSDNSADAIRNGVNFQRKKTHCPKGHPLVPGNLEPNQLTYGWRSCWLCARIRSGKAKSDRSIYLWSNIERSSEQYCSFPQG